MLKNLLKKLKAKYQHWQNLRKFRRAKSKAIKLNSLTGKRWHVLPVAGTMDYLVVDNSYINRYNRYVKKKADKIDINILLKMSYYSTETKTRKKELL